MIAWVAAASLFSVMLGLYASSLSLSSALFGMYASFSLSSGLPGMYASFSLISLLLSGTAGLSIRVVAPFLVPFCDHFGVILGFGGYLETPLGSLGEPLCHTCPQGPSRMRF